MRQEAFFAKRLAFVSTYLGSAVKSLAKQIASLVLLLLTTCSVVAQTPVQVEIEAVEVRNNSISVTHNGKSRKLTLAPNVEITIDGKKAALASLLPGHTASVIYDKEAAAVTSIAAQRTAMLPAEKLAEGWDQIDDRLIFLMVRLASTEASLEATENAIAASSRNQTRKTGQVRQAENKNEDMDRKGGGPMKWSLFYGRTAESFFYHPTDRNTTYHTTTILSQQAPVNDNQAGPGVPSRQGLPVHQRPPQFDYIYRANESAKARAERDIAQLIGKAAELIERKQRLEAEQAGLWCEVAFRSVSHYDLDKKPLYRFEPLMAKTDSDARVQLETIRSAASFMALALSIVDAAQKDQPATLSKIKPAVAKARQDMNDAWLRIGVDVTDRKSAEGRFHALAKKLEESASNLSDSYLVALEGDMAKDQQRKDTFRGLLQESIIRYAEIILALDEMATLMKDDWQIKPDVDKPIKFVGLEKTEASWGLAGLSDPTTFNTSGEALPVTRTTALFNGVSLDGWHTEGSQWTVNKGILIGEKLDPNGTGSFLVSDNDFRDFVLYAEFKLHEGNSGIQIRSIKQSTGMVIGPQADITFQQDYRWLGCLTGERIQPEMIAQTSQAVKDRLRQVVDPNGWNSMKISVRASQTTIFINDVKTVQSSLPTGFESGVIALQLHGGGRTRIEFRKIEIEEIKNEQAFDPFKQNSVWDDGGVKLTVIERRGGTFRARLECNEWARNIRGTIKDGQVTWLAKGVQPIKGGTGGDNFATISKDENGYPMDVEWQQANGVSGTGTYRLND